MFLHCLPNTKDWFCLVCPIPNFYLEDLLFPHQTLHAPSGDVLTVVVTLSKTIEPLVRCKIIERDCNPNNFLESERLCASLRYLGRG